MESLDPPTQPVHTQIVHTSTFVCTVLDTTRSSIRTTRQCFVSAGTAALVHPQTPLDPEPSRKGPTVTNLTEGTPTLTLPLLLIIIIACLSYHLVICENCCIFMITKSNDHARQYTCISIFKPGPVGL